MGSSRRERAPVRVLVAGGRGGQFDRPTLDCRLGKMEATSRNWMTFSQAWNAKATRSCARRADGPAVGNHVRLGPLLEREPRPVDPLALIVIHVLAPVRV